MTHLYACVGATQVSVRLAPEQDSFNSPTRRTGVVSQILRFGLRLQLSQSRCLSLLLAQSTRVYPLIYSTRPYTSAHLPRLSQTTPLPPMPSFPFRRYAKRPDVALYAIGRFFLLHTPSSPHCTLKVSEHDSIWQPPVAHSDKRLRPRSLLVRIVVSMIVHLVISKARLYKFTQWSGLLRGDPIMQSKTRWCMVRSLE